MKPGIFNKIFIRPTLGESLDAVGALGIENVQFNPETLSPEIPREFIQRNITVSVLSATYNIIHPDPVERRRGLDRFRSLASYAHTLGTNTLSVCTGTRDPENMWRKHADNDTPESWRDMVSAMATLAAIAEDHNITIAFEPEQANVIDNAQKARSLLGTLQSAHVKVLIDPANLLTLGNLPRQNQVLQEAFDLVGADIVAAHAKEFSADGKLGNAALGKGIVNFPLYLSLLRAAAFENAVIMHGFSEPEAAESLRYLNALFMRQ